MSYEVLIMAGGAAVGGTIALYALRRRIFGHGRTEFRVIETTAVKEVQSEPASRPSVTSYESVQPQMAPAQASMPSASAPSLTSARRTRMYKRRAPPRRPATLRQNTRFQTPSPVQADEGPKSDQ